MLNRIVVFMVCAGVVLAGCSDIEVPPAEMVDTPSESAPAVPEPEPESAEPELTEPELTEPGALPLAEALESVCPNAGNPKQPYPNALSAGDDLHKLTLDGADAVCNDGTPAVLFVRGALTAAAANRWVFYMGADPLERHRTSKTSAAYMTIRC